MRFLAENLLVIWKCSWARLLKRSMKLFLTAQVFMGAD